MTVCTASIFAYGAQDRVFTGVITASDRMLTDVRMGIEYEGSRQKIAFFPQDRSVLVAGDLPFNSLVLKRLEALEVANVSATTLELADRLGDVVSALNSERGWRKFLDPLGITPAILETTDGGLSGLGLTEALVKRLQKQLQRETAESEFIVLGCDQGNAGLFHVDGRGTVTSHNNIGFLSIGDGGIHSSAYFMQLPYRHDVDLHRGLIGTFFAKKRAEICPGVGLSTDMQVVSSEGILRVDDYIVADLQAAFDSYTQATSAQLDAISREVREAFEKKAVENNSTVST